MLGLDDEPREQEATDYPSRGKGDAVLEHEMLIRDAWHRNAVSMAFATRESVHARGRLPRSTPTILEEDSSLASE